MPFPVVISNICDSTDNLCTHKKILIKSWIAGFSDTSTITDVVMPDSEIILSPSFKFYEEALYALNSPKQAQRQVEAYALENDQQILFYSISRPVTIHPMHFFGDEPFAFENPYFWLGVWVTPFADSISSIVKDVAKELPNGNLSVYQPIFPEVSIELNSKIVVGFVFNALRSRNIKYVQDLGTTKFIGQKINYPTETLRKKQGICIETTTLFASILERIGFHTFIILIPGHSFVGWLTEQDGNTIDVVETTMIGNENVTFADANNLAINEYKEQIELGNFESGKSVIIELEKIRNVGIKPNNIP